MRENLATDLTQIFDQAPSDDDLTCFYGRFAQNTGKFAFAPGERKLISIIVEYAKETLNKNGVKYFARNENETCEDSRRFFGCAKLNDNNSNDAENENTGIDPNKSLTHYFLNLLHKNAEQNFGRERQAYRFSDEIKSFATYFRMISGRLAYDTIQNNLNLALPSIVSINR